VNDGKRRDRDRGGFLRHWYRKSPPAPAEGRISVDAGQYVRAHPQAAELTVDGCTVGVSSDAPHAATISIPVTRPGPLTVRISVAGSDGTVLLDEKFKLDVVPPGFRGKLVRHPVPSAHVTIEPRGTLTIRFPRKRAAAA